MNQILALQQLNAEVEGDGEAFWPPCFSIYASLVTNPSTTTL